MSGRSAPQPGWAKLVAVGAAVVIPWILRQTIGSLVRAFTSATIPAAGPRPS